MHVRSAAGEISQTGRLEPPKIRVFMGDLLPACIDWSAVHADAQVGELLIREVGTVVAFRAFALAVEEVQAVLFLFAKGVFVTRDETIVAGVAGEDRAFKGAYALRDAVEGDTAISEGGSKQRRIARN